MSLHLKGGPASHHGGADRTPLRRHQSNAVESEAMVMPLARGLSILSAFEPGRAWLGNREIARETGLPTPTVSRLLHSLVTLGYLRHDEARRKYCLAAPALSLGYAATVDAEIQRVGGVEMRHFAEATDTYVLLGTRDRLDVIVLETCVGSHAVLDLKLPPGTRVRIDSSLLGAALLAALPEEERRYLQGALGRRAGRKWSFLRQRMAEKISQVSELGFCMFFAEWEPALACIAAPVHIPQHSPLVLGCIGLAARMARIRVDRELGPRLVATAQALQAKLSAHA